MDRMRRVGRKNRGNSSLGDCKGKERTTLTACYLCGQRVDGMISSRDHVIPQTLRDKLPPKVRGFDYGGVLPTHPECNNRFDDETYVRKAMQILGALHDSNTTLARPAPGKQEGHVLVLNEEKLTEFSLRDFRFFGIHDARNDLMASFDNPEYYADKPSANFRKTVTCTTLSVLTKSAAALLVKRYLPDLPRKWNVVCILYAGDAKKADLSFLFRETKPFTKEIRVSAKKFEDSSWFVSYVTSTALVLSFFLMENDCHLVADIQNKFSDMECFRFESETLMDLDGHDWPSIGHARSKGKHHEAGLE